MKRWLLLSFALLLCLPVIAQTTVQPILQPRVTFFDSTGAACASCSLYSYAAGTTTPLATYTDSTGTSQNPNPLVLDASGSGTIWMALQAYKFVLKDTLGNTLWTVDNVTEATGIVQDAAQYCFYGQTQTGTQALANCVPHMTFDANGNLTANSFIGPVTGNSNTATSLNGGILGDIPYQSAANTTAFLAPQTVNGDYAEIEHVTAGTAVAPSWSNAPALSGANLTALPASSGVYPALCTGTQFSQGLSPGSNNCTSVAPEQRHKQIFTTSGTFTIPAGISAATAFQWTIIGGGGGGASGNTASVVGGPGGGAGATARVLSTGYTAGNTIVVTVGTGGTGGPSGSSGTSGGNSSIASGTQTITTVTAASGAGGIYSSTGGSGGAPSGGDADSVYGGDGTTCFNSGDSGCSGGASSQGGGGYGGFSGGVGNPGRAFGSGGGGGSRVSSAAGGNGAAGIVIVEWNQ